MDRSDFCTSLALLLLLAPSIIGLAAIAPLVAATFIEIQDALALVSAR